jgi:cell division protein FtsI/penicillin-binding protein 2
LAPLVALWILLVLRLLQVQILERGRYQNMAKIQYTSREVKHALRGEILDRRLSPLATNQAAYSVGIDTRLLKEPTDAARRIAEVLGGSPQALLRRFLKENGFMWLGRKLESEKVDALRQLNLNALVFKKEYRRVYPFGRTAAHVVGFTGIDNEGLAGTELRFDSELRGKDGWAYVQRDAYNGEFVDLSKPSVAPKDGKHLVLTIDYVFQTIVEEELRRAVKEYSAVGGCAVVTDPRTGEVLAMASEPSFDPNRFTEFPKERFRNRAISEIFEPGSTFKIVTMSALLETRTKKPTDIVFAENGVYRLAGRTIRDHERYGWLTVADVLKNSSNIGTVKLGMELGNMRLFRFARAFGFGALTGIDLPGETGGLLNQPTRWSRLTPASVSIGYEVGVTALQMAMAYGAIANGGKLLQPIIAAGTFDTVPREIPELQPIVIRRVLSPATAEKMRWLLERVVQEGTGAEARIEGLRIAGKTGTAQKPRKDGSGYSNTDYVASFVGFYPADAPELLVFVMIDTPRPVYWGGKVAAPTFRRILERILRIRADQSVPARRPGPSENEDSGRALAVRVPNVIDRSATVATAMLEGMDLKVRLEGEGRFVEAQVPAPGETVAPKSRVLLRLYSGVREKRVKLPKLVGRTMREAIAALAARGLTAVVYGSGVVVRQEPAPGSTMAVGSRAAIYCQEPVSVRLTGLK